MVQSRRWCFTINNWTNEDAEECLALRDIATYAIFGKERGEEGTEHLQGYVFLKRKTTLAGLKKVLSRAHLEIARGNHEQASDYCKKDGDFTEIGERPSDDNGEVGKRSEKSRWDTAKALAMEGRVEEIDSKLYIQYYATFKRIAKDHMQMFPDLDGKLLHEWWYGEPGVGKSRKAHSEFPGAYRKPLNKWWDGYEEEAVVIIDEVEKESKMFGHLFKIWGDRYSFIGETKGSARPIRPEKIIIISNYSIQEVFCEDRTLQKAIERRYKQVHFNTYFT